jgi:murein DD-endopeptidase MepM/ murein hydrolase activator NlpD
MHLAEGAFAGFGMLLLSATAVGADLLIYGHMSRRAVSVGQHVSAGQIIGYVGSTGNSDGDHLHFEVRVDFQNSYQSKWYTENGESC